MCGIKLSQLVDHFQGATPGSSEGRFDQLPGITGWFDASDQATHGLTGNVMTDLANKIEGGLSLKALPDGGPEYHPTIANGHPALVWPDLSNKKGMGVWHPGLQSFVDADISEMFIVCQYRDGLVTRPSGDTPPHKTDDYIAFCTTANGLNRTSNDNSRLLINGTSSNLWTGANMDVVSVNSAGFSSAILPLPLSVVRVSASQSQDGTFRISTVGGPDRDYNRSWRGYICEILTFAVGAPLTGEMIAEIERELLLKRDITI